MTGNIDKIIEKKENFSEYRRGLKNGIPICLGYLAVSFSLGLAAGRSGLGVIPASLSSLLLNASAGGYALFSVIAASGGYIQTAASVAIANLRYLLMSCALSEKLDGCTRLWQRLLMGFAVTDEMFAIGVMQSRKLNPWFYLGMMSLAVPGWCSGTALGVAVGNVIGTRLQSALGVSLYGMFVASVMPPAKRSAKVAAVVCASALLSLVCSFVPVIKDMSESVRVIILTVIVACAAAVLFPIKEEKE